MAIINDLHVIHFTVEAILVALIGVLFRRLEAARREMRALGTAQGLMKRRFEAATAGLHTRLLAVERAVKQHAAAARPTLELVRSGDPAIKKTQLSRGELEVLMKVRQLNGGAR
jgi:hypothetical protein